MTWPKKGDRVRISTLEEAKSYNILADDFVGLAGIEGLRGWVAAPPFTLALHDVTHVIVQLDSGNYAELVVQCVEPLDAIDRLAEIAHPPPPLRPLPKPVDRRPWWRKALDFLLSPFSLVDTR